MTERIKAIRLHIESRPETQDDEFASTGGDVLLLSTSVQGIDTSTFF